MQRAFVIMRFEKKKQTVQLDPTPFFDLNTVKEWSVERARTGVKKKQLKTIKSPRAKNNAAKCPCSFERGGDYVVFVAS